MILTLQEILLSRWGSLGIKCPPPAQLSFMRVGFLFSAEGEGVATFLCFCRSKRKPVCAIKVAKAPRFSKHVEQEYNNLLRARELLDDASWASVPAPLELLEVDGCKALVESFLDGTTFLRRIRPRGGWLHQRRVARELKLVVDWVSFIRCSSGGDRLMSGEYTGDLAEKYERHSEPSSEEKQFLASIIDGADRLQMPLAPVHGDFVACNLLRMGDRIGAFDWCFFGEHAPPLTDFVMFTLSRPATGQESWFPERVIAPERERCSGNWYEVQLRRSLEKICRNWRVELSVVPVLWGVSLLYMATFDWSLVGQRPYMTELFRSQVRMFAPFFLGSKWD